MTFNCMELHKILILLFETVDLQPSIKHRLCFPAGLCPDSQSLCACVFVPLPRAWPCLRLPVSLTRMHLLTQGGDDRRRQCLRAVTSAVTAAHTHGSRRLLWPFPYMGFDTSPPPAQFVFRHTVSTCYCCPPAGLRVCQSVCQPASGLRREASFIKRKQAGDEDMRTVNLLEM